MKGDIKASLPFDPFAIAQASTEFALGLAARPADLLEVQITAAQQWGDFWTRALSGQPTDAPRDRRFASPQWQDDPYFRSIRDSYLLASEQLRDLVSLGTNGTDSNNATIRFLLDQYLNAVAPTNFAHTNPEVLKRTKETNGANLVQGFAHLIEDMAQLMLKDLKLAMEAAQAAGAYTPMGAEAEELYERFVNLGGGPKDFSALIKMIDDSWQKPAEDAKN